MQKIHFVINNNMNTKNKQHFVYIWFDIKRKMFYIGSHFGKMNDSYLSSSKWLSGEIRYRPLDFKRRIIKFCESKEEALQIEYNLLSKIKEKEFGQKYYNIKSGRSKGCTPWNKGKQNIYSEESLQKMSDAKKGKPKSSIHRQKISQTLKEHYA